MDFWLNRDPFLSIQADLFSIQTKIQLNREYFYVSNFLKVWPLDPRDFISSVPHENLFTTNHPLPCSIQATSLGTGKGIPPKKGVLEAALGIISQNSRKCCWYASAGVETGGPGGHGHREGTDADATDSLLASGCGGPVGLAGGRGDFPRLNGRGYRL